MGEMTDEPQGASWFAGYEAAVQVAEALLAEDNEAETKLADAVAWGAALAQFLRALTVSYASVRVGSGDEIDGLLADPPAAIREVQERLMQTEEHRTNERQPSGHRYCCALELWGRECPDEGPPTCTCDFERAQLAEAKAQKDALVTALEPFAGGGGHAYGYDDCRHCTAYQVLARVRSGEGKQ